MPGSIPSLMKLRAYTNTQKEHIRTPPATSSKSGSAVLCVEDAASQGFQRILSEVLADTFLLSVKADEQVYRLHGQMRRKKHAGRKKNPGVDRAMKNLPSADRHK